MTTMRIIIRTYKSVFKTSDRFIDEVVMKKSLNIFTKNGLNKLIILYAKKYLAEN